MAMVNQIPSPPMAVPYNLANVKDSRWLTLEVCREFQRNKCTRTETECKFAHPPPNVEVQNGRVTCCFDSIKGKCQRKDPPCKYLHPPQHLREQLLQNGKNNLILRNLQMQVAQFGLQPMVQNVIPFAHPHYPSPVQTAAAYNPYSHLSTAAQGHPATSVHAVSVSNSDSIQTQPGQQIIYSNPATQVASTAAAKLTRPDRLEAGPESVLHETSQCLQCPGSMNGLPAGLPAGFVPCIKRTALADKCTGLPTMYQQVTAANNLASYYPAAALAAMQIPPGPTFVPVSSQHFDDPYWKNGYFASFPGAITGHPSHMQRF